MSTTSCLSHATPRINCRSDLNKISAFYPHKNVSNERTISSRRAAEPSTIPKQYVYVCIYFLLIVFRVNLKSYPPFDREHIIIHSI